MLAIRQTLSFYCDTYTHSCSYGTKKSPFNNLPAVIFIELDASDGVAPDKQNAMLGCV